MLISKEKKLAWRIQILYILLVLAVFGGLFLLRRGGRSGTWYWILLFICAFLFPRRWLPDIRAVLSDWWGMGRQETLRLLKTAFLSTLVFTLIIHGFLFTNEFFSHDGLTMCIRSFDYYLSLGRPLLSLYEFLRGSSQQPFLIGVLFVIWMTLANVLAIRLLNFHDPLYRLLVCGLLCSNTALIHAGATYVFCIDEYAFSLFIALAAAWFFRFCDNAELIGVLCVAISLMFYQAYFTVTAAFCFFTLIRPLANNTGPASIIWNGIRSLGLLFAGFCLYYLSWSALCSVFHVEPLRIDRTIFALAPIDIFRQIIKAYRDWFSLQLESRNVLGRLYPAINILVCVLILLWLVLWLLNRRLSKLNRTLLVLAVFLLPAAFNASYILFPKGSYLLISVNQGLLGVFLLLCMDLLPPQTPAFRCRAAAALLAFSLIWHGAVFANTAYLKKELEKSATLSMVTRILDRIEQLDGYIPGETPVFFMGSLVNNTLLSDGRPGFEAFTAVYSGALKYDYAATYNIGRYVERYLNYPIVTVSRVLSGEEIPDMPAFPTKGSVRFVGDTVVVKLS